MAEASVTFAVGSEQATVVLPVDLPAGGETIITGDFGGLVAAGTVARFRGDVNMTGNIHVRGTLTCDEAGVNVNGNGFDIHTHDGTLNLVGTEKTAWCRWGDTPVGWQVGDRLAVAPTAVGAYLPSETIWQGSWPGTTRPANAPDVTLVDGSIARPEVANLSQTVTLRNLQRIMIHEASAPNPQTFKWIRVLDSGEALILGMYPIHFHMIGDHARGSTLEGVVVEGGKNHAFVPHASHGITYDRCVAYNTTGPAYWWDPPIPNQTPPHTVNNSDDIAWTDCLALWMKTGSDVGNSRTTGFSLGAGQGLSCVGSVAACAQGSVSNSSQRSGFHWPENAEEFPWVFRDCVGHNNINSGIYVWQNARRLENIVEDFVGYHNQRADIEHGAYMNRYQYHGAVLTGAGFLLHAKSAIEGPLDIEDILSDAPLVVTRHQSPFTGTTFIRRCSFPSVTYQEPTNGSVIHYEDCGLIPSDFDLAGIAADSIIEIKEGGTLTHRWASGVWS